MTTRSFAELTGWWLPQTATPFLIPDLDRDVQMRLYLTPSLARESHDPHVKAMYRTAQRYFDNVRQVIDAYIAGDAGIEAVDKLLAFPECEVLRLGYTRQGHAGNGPGDQATGAALRNFLLENAALRELLAEEPDLLQSVPRFGADRVTDAFGWIVLLDLIRFTQQYSKVMPIKRTRRFTFRHLYDGETGTFRDRLDVELLYDDRGFPIIFVPTILLRGSSIWRSRDFMEASLPAGTSLTKAEILARLGNDVDRLRAFALPRLDYIKPHRKLYRAG